MVLLAVPPLVRERGQPLALARQLAQAARLTRPQGAAAAVVVPQKARVVVAVASIRWGQAFRETAAARVAAPVVAVRLQVAAVLVDPQAIMFTKAQPEREVCQPLRIPRQALQVAHSNRRHRKN